MCLRLNFSEKSNTTSSVVWSPIQPKKLDNRKSIDGGGWRWRESAGGRGGGSEWVGQYLKKVGRHPFLHYKTNPSPHSWLRRGRGMGSHYVNARVTTQKTRKLHRKVFRKINESTWGTSSWIKQLWNTRSVSTQL